MTRSAAFISIHITLAIFFPAVMVEAQVTTATVYGLVLDPSAATVPGAEVVLQNPLTMTTMSGKTNERGEFTLAFLPVGTYTISITAPGFKTYSETGLQLAAGGKRAINFTLELGSQSETVSVSAARPLLQSSSAEQNLTIERLRIADLPLLNRDFSKLVNLGAGVITGSSRTEMGNNASSGQGTKVSINGLAPNSFTFTIDGIDGSSDPLSPSIAQYQNFNYIKGVSIEAIDEVQVAKDIFSAEISSAASGNVNVITKGGTNELHGSAFDLYRSGGLNARDPFLPRAAPLVFHQFGGSLGGPFIKDRLFFFGVYEGYRQTSQTSVNGNVLTEDFRRRALAAIPAYRPLLELFPLPNQPHTATAATGFYQGAGAERRYDNHGTLKIDWNARSTDFVSFRVTRAQPFRSQPRVVASNPRVWDCMNYSVAASLTHATSRRSLQTRFGRNFSDFIRTDGTYERGLPGVSVLGVSHSAESLPTDGPSTTVEETVAESVGRHSFKYGGIYQLRQGGFADNQIPVYTYVTADEFLANNPTQIQFTLGAPKIHLARWHVGGFFQDDIRLTNRLMVNLGFRYDYWSVPKEKEGRLFNRDGPFGPLRPSDSMMKRRSEQCLSPVGIRVVSWFQPLDGGARRRRCICNRNPLSRPDFAGQGGGPERAFSGYCE